ncbi:VOC family protein [Allomesorhizobium camelthorni]|uniref:Glyoxalase n=1 Tax=Allomesorhizobium camelthorni TaxID=475069 RepID=A0A6G4WJW1_9HYPH|nr:VOC family protein [Mesorhizobium camelthorni]NGO55051.1 glyoxalase [Mesorhizobium camelthorni]
MGQPVVHFEIIGKEPEKLQRYYGELFGWTFDTSSPVSEAISNPTDYGFVDSDQNGGGIPGGVAGGEGYDGHVTFYVGVDDVETALRNAESLGGTRRLGPVRSPSGNLVVGKFEDPEGHLIGVACTK